MLAAGSFGRVPPSAAPPQGPLGKQVGPVSAPPHPANSHSVFEFFSSAPIPWRASFWNILSTRKGEPWKILLSASSRQRDYSIYVRPAKE